MARPCSICSHLDRDAIDLALVGGSTQAAVAERFDVTRDSLARHQRNHVTPSLVRLAQQRRNDASAVSVLDRLEDLVDRTTHFIDKAERKGSLVAGAQLLGQMRQSLELIARLTGELDERPVTQVLNISTSPDWLSLRSAILHALAGHPEARADVLAALSSGATVDAIEVGGR